LKLVGPDRSVHESSLFSRRLHPCVLQHIHPGLIMLRPAPGVRHKPAPNRVSRLRDPRRQFICSQKMPQI
jgi:hypothetical protein